MHEICKKNMQKYASKLMIKYAKNCKKYANICRAVYTTEICFTDGREEIKLQQSGP